MKNNEERRRSARIPLKVPLVIEGTDAEGNHFREQTETENVSLQGACLKTVHKMAHGSLLKISAVKFPFKATACVRLVWLDEVDGVLKMGIEFTDNAQNWILK